MSPETREAVAWFLFAILTATVFLSLGLEALRRHLDECRLGFNAEARRCRREDDVLRPKKFYGIRRRY